MANRWPDIPMILESDCQSVVTQLQAKIHDCSVLWQVIEEARDVGGQLRRMDTVKISRDQNKLAHELVQFAIRFRKCQSFFFWLAFQSGLSHSLVSMLLKCYFFSTKRKK